MTTYRPHTDAISCSSLFCLDVAGGELTMDFSLIKIKKSDHRYVGKVQRRKREINEKFFRGRP